MRAASRKQQQSRQPRNSTTACLVTLLSGGGGSMAAAAAASRPSRASSLAAGVVPAFAARVSSSLASKRNHGDREVGSGRSSLVAVGRRTSSRGRRSNYRGVSTAVSMSVEGWRIQPRGLGLPGGAFSRAGGWPPAVGDRRRTLAISAATTEGAGRFDSTELLKMSYRDLQKLAKENDVRANQAGEAIINDLVALGANPARGPDSNGEDVAVPATGESSDWVAGVLDEDIMAGVDLEADGEDDADGEDSETYAQAVKRATSGKFTAIDMEGLKGGVDRGDGWVTFKLGKGDARGLDGEGDDDYFDDDDDYDDEEGGGGDDMDARIRDAEASRFRLSPEMMASSAEDFGFGRDAADLEKLTITVPTGCCPGCGSKFQSEDPASPGFLQLDKLDGLLGDEGVAATVMTAEDTRGAAAVATDEADMDPEAWLEAQSDINTDLDFDLDLADEDDDDDGGDPRGEWVEGSYGSPAGVPAGGGGGLGRASRDTAVLAGRAPATTTTAAAAAAAAGATELSSKEAVAGWGLPGTGMATLEEEGEEEQEKLLVCQRCYRLRNYGSVEDTLRPGFSDSDLLTPQRFLELLGSIRKQRCLIIYLVDLFDFHGTFLYNLPKITGNNPVLVAGNKVDLLPKDLKRQRVTKWVRDKCRESGLPDMEMRDVHLVSCKHGVGIPPLMRKGGKGGGRGGKAPTVAGRGVTVSSVPGTTLDFLKARSCHKRALYDTPGLLLPHTLTSRLNAEELRAAIPKKKVDHVTFRMGEGKVVLVGGLARVEVVTGRPFLLTFFVSNDVRLHPTDARRVDDMLSEHVGKGQMIFPPFDPERVDELGPLVPTDFDIMGAGWREVREQ
ncbi:unnamed protein product [Ectocarpus sp. 4 AP-2014]